MFVISEMKHVTRMIPKYFNINLNDAISNELNRKLANKVVLNVGLCIALYDITNIKESFLMPGDGASHTAVTFRFVVFRPFIEEILLGKIRSCNQEGVHVTLGFFDDILIPPTALPHPSRFDETEQAWVWEYDDSDGNKHDLYMDAGESIKFRITAESFGEIKPEGSDDLQNPTDGSINSVPYSLTGSINESGLGLTSWWNKV